MWPLAVGFMPNCRRPQSLDLQLAHAVSAARFAHKSLACTFSSKDITTG